MNVHRPRYYYPPEDYGPSPEDLEMEGQVIGGGQGPLDVPPTDSDEKLVRIGFAFLDSFKWIAVVGGVVLALALVHQLQLPLWVGIPLAVLVLPVAIYLLLSLTLILLMAVVKRVRRSDSTALPDATKPWKPWFEGERSAAPTPGKAQWYERRTWVAYRNQELLLEEETKLLKALLDDHMSPEEREAKFQALERLYELKKRTSSDSTPGEPP